MHIALLTSKVSITQILYEMGSGKQNRGVHQKSMNKTKHKEEKKFQKWKKDKKDKKDKSKGKP